MSRPLASLSLDLDNKWSYLKTHGDPGWDRFPSYLDVVVPRFLSLFGDLGVRVTVFVVGQDAALPRNHAALAAIVNAGHEIGNHSFNHEPWLHLYTPEQLEEELSAAENAIEEAVGVQPIGFRGPGFSVTPAVLASLANRGYRYDASTLPSFLGPLARAYYFWTARVSPAERERRKRLFGVWSEGLRPLRPYWWRCDGDQVAEVAGGGRLMEIPVTTMPVFRAPIHVSYLLYLRQFSRAAAWAYWRLAMVLCRVTGLGPSLLLHPLDLLGGDDEPDLAFFPAMKMPGAEKAAFVREILEDFTRRFQVVSLGEHAAALALDGNLATRNLGPATRAATPSLAAEALHR